MVGVLVVAFRFLIAFVCCSVCLSVHLFANNMTQKVMNGLR